MWPDTTPSDSQPLLTTQGRRLPLHKAAFLSRSIFSWKLQLKRERGLDLIPANHGTAQALGEGPGGSASVE